MRNKINWDYYVARRFLHSFQKRYTKKGITRYAGRDLYLGAAGNEEIYNILSAGKPCCISRFGSTELTSMVYREAKMCHRFAKNVDHKLCLWSGFFPEETKLIDRFYEFMLERIKDVDMLGIWNTSMEEYMIAKYMPNTKLTGLGSIEPYYFDNPWSRILKGKKVLVIHPFEDSIRSQYARRELIFPNDDILPEFELITLKSVQTLAGTKDDRFATWFDALQYMIDKMHVIDYDIAIIGCGAYGMPLAIEAKRSGKQAVHIGGATQILFGITGARWDTNAGITRFYNDAWVRPSESERLKRGNEVENGCYW